MSVSQKKIKQLYDELKLELKICKIGGLFLALYKDKDVAENIINNMRRELTNQFIFTINMDERKVPFSTFFGQSFEQIGKQSNIYHVIGIEKLSTSSIIDFIRYLQYGRERFKSKPYSIVFWLTPQLEKQLFHLAPDFHHWIFGTYDFTHIDSRTLKSLKLGNLTEVALNITLKNIEEYLEKVIWQYEHWQEAKAHDEDFLIEIMGRSNLHEYYVQSYCFEEPYLKITDESLEKLKASQIPLNIFKELESIKNLEFKGDKKFIEEIKSKVGSKQTNEYKIKILRAANARTEEKLLDDVLINFLHDDSKYFLTLLGDFGTGKSSFSIHFYIYLAKKYLKDKNGRIPIFISLKNYPGKLNIEDFIIEEFYKKYNIKFTYSIFQNFALSGKFVFFIDGFDEMASLVNQDLTVENFKELTKLTFENVLFMIEKPSETLKANKVFLTCRTHYFLNEIQEKELLKADYTVLYRNYATKSNYEITRIKIKEFNKKQIKEYISKNTKDEEQTKDFIKIINDTYNLNELSTRPLLLEMIIKTLPRLVTEEKVNVANLYKEYTDTWINREDWRAQMTPEGKRNFMWQLSLKMFNKEGNYSLHFSELEKPKKKYLKRSYIIKGTDYYKYETTTCSFLNRDSRGNYKFIHKSFMEYFLAECFFYALFKNRRIIDQSKFNDEIRFFLKFIFSSNKDKLYNLNLAYLDLHNFELEGANLAKSNLSFVDLHQSNLIGAIMKDTNLSNCNLNMANLNNVNLINANLNGTKLDGAILSNSILYKSDLRGTSLKTPNLGITTADLSGANIRDGNLSGLYLKRANLSHTNLENANLENTDLRNSKLIGSNLRGANLKGAYLSFADLSNSDLSGADLRHADFSCAKAKGTKFSHSLRDQWISIRLITDSSTRF